MFLYYLMRSAEQQYHRTIVSLSISSLVLGFITIGFDICISRGRLLIEMLRDLGKRDWIFLLYFAGSFSLIFNIHINSGYCFIIVCLYLDIIVK